MKMFSFICLMLTVFLMMTGCSADEAVSNIASDNGGTNDTAVNNDHNSTTDNGGSDTAGINDSSTPDYGKNDSDYVIMPDNTVNDNYIPDNTVSDNYMPDNTVNDADAVTETDADTVIDTDNDTPISPDKDEASDADAPKPGDILENPFIFTNDEAKSTFGIDVDTASYSIVRRYLTYNTNLPPKEKVRIEELINYFDYDYPVPAIGAANPFSVTIEMAPCPWNESHSLMMIGLKGKEIPKANRKPSNLVFLIDKSGSMEPANRLPLLKNALNLLTDNLTSADRISIITFADQAATVLEPRAGSDKAFIKAAIDSLVAGGSTNGGAGIELAYQTAEKNLSKDMNNRVILATDGEFNSGGFTNEAQLEQLISDKKQTGIFLTVLGFGDPTTLADGNLETLADKGNGSYYYIDNQKECNRVLNDKASSLLFTIAKDVKIQVEFNPMHILKYRLIGYDNRVMENSEFNNDSKDAGELNAGHTVTAFYEFEFVDGSHPMLMSLTDTQFAEVDLRYKEPEATDSTLVKNPVSADLYSATMSETMAFASAVTEFGLLIRQSAYKFDSSYDSVINRANTAIGTDEWGIRTEFVTLAGIAKSLTP